MEPVAKTHTFLCIIVLCETVATGYCLSKLRQHSAREFKSAQSRQMSRRILKTSAEECVNESASGIDVHRKRSDEKLPTIIAI